MYQSGRTPISFATERRAEQWRQADEWRRFHAHTAADASSTTEAAPGRPLAIIRRLMLRQA
jgi:hypothetical protein